MTHPRLHHRTFARPRSPDIGGRAAAPTTLLTTLALLLGCGSNTTAPKPTPPAANKTVDATPSFTFTPASLTIAPGDTVTFAFGTLAHNVFFDAQTGAPADIPGSLANVSVPRVFATPGTYRYTCHIHPRMVGTVVVAAPSASYNVGGS